RHTVTHRVGEHRLGPGGDQLGAPVRSGAVHRGGSGHRAAQDLPQPRFEGHLGSGHGSTSCPSRTSASTPSRILIMMSSSCASTFSLSSGSVLEERRLNHHRGALSQWLYVTPSNSSTS